MDRKEMWSVARGALADHASLLIRCLMFTLMLTLVAMLDVDTSVVFVLAAAAFGSELLPKTLISFPEGRERRTSEPDDDAPASADPATVCPPGDDAGGSDEVKVRSVARTG